MRRLGYERRCHTDLEPHAPLLPADRAERAMLDHITIAGEWLLLKMLMNLAGTA
jgi:hypothetical protein